jgi:ribosomal protein S18 acetylase RimI-like enzyme
VDVRDYSSAEDLRAMQELVAECWRLEGPYVDSTIGDLPWSMYQHLDKLDEVRVGLVEEDGRCVAWGWLWDAAESRVLFQQTHPDRRECLADVLDWSDAKEVSAIEHDHASIELLEARGYELDLAEGWMNHMLHDLADVPAPEVPDGYVVRTVRGEDDLVPRVDVHRAAFAPSRVVPESYRQVMAAWPYRAELDNVVEARDGSFAAFCLCWYDEANRMAELEPVGTHPAHQRRGLGTAVCRAGLRGVKAAGGERAIIYSVSGSGAEKLYESIGFKTISRHLTFRKRR